MARCPTRGARWAGRALSALLAASVGTAPLLAVAGPAGGEPASEDIGELWQRAQARIDTAEYDEAIELLTRLYDAIALDPDAATLRQRVQWALHRAHVGAHGVDGDLQHLYVARDLLDKYQEALPPGEVERRTEAETARTQVQAAIDEQEAREAEARAAEERAAAEREAAEREAAEREAARRQAEVVSAQETGGADEPPPAESRGLIIAGAVGAGLGLVGFGVMAGGLGSANAAVDTFINEPDEREDARDDVRRGNTIGIVGATAGGVLVVGGAVLLAVGLRRRAAVKGSLAAGPGTVGVGWRWRF